ncbi:MAG: hypothetical protein ABIQ93_16955, partial [Saprospiraceae bacterium]
APMRRIIRPGSRLMKTVGFTPAAPAGNLIARVNAGEIKPAPPKTTPSAIPTLDDLANASMPINIPKWLVKLIERYPWVK